MNSRERAAWTAWLLTASYFFYQYALRSCPSVMIPELSTAFGLSAGGIATLLGMFYCGYAAFSLVAGVALDWAGARAAVPAGAAIVACGAVLFGTGSVAAATLGRILQGAGGAFAFVGTVFIASRNFPASRAATLIGAAQMFGMAGGAAGQFAVGPLIESGIPWNVFWMAMGVAGLVLSILLFALIPPERIIKRHKLGFRNTIKSLVFVLRNPQSLLCGLIAGLLFIPTTIFDMTWGVRFLQEAHGFGYGEAVLRSATVPAGWIIGSPLLGWFSDRLGRRKPVMIGGAAVLVACLAWILYGPTGVIPPYLLGLITGIASGGAMIAYTVIKEANPPGLSGTATGVINCLNLTLTSLLSPIFGRMMETVSQTGSPGLEHYQLVFQPLLYGVVLALLLTLALKETGPTANASMITQEAA